MAVASGSHPLNFGNIGCGFRPSSGTLRAYIDSVTSNGLQSNGKIEYVVKVSGSASINNLVWSSASGTQSWSFSCGGQTQSATTSKQCQSTGNCAGGGCCCCICNGITYNPGQKTFTLQLSPSTTTITLNVKWNTNGPATATYTIPESMRVTPPSGLSVSWPSSLSGSTASSVSSWGGAAPGCYTLQLLSPSGSSLGSTTSCTSYTSTQYQDTPGSYSANSRYRLKVTACNDANMCVSDTSSYYYTPPPTPSVYIDSLLYDPNSQKCVCNWSWSKPSDEGYYDETITYDVYDQEGNYYVRGGSLGTATGGVAKSGSQTTTNILTAVNLCVKVYVSTSAGVSSATACAYAPVAGAAFLGFDWDELRRTCTVRATAPGARQTRVSGGYAPNVYSIGSKVTPGELGDLVVKDLDHGAGEILYLEAMPEATDNHQYIDEVAKISIPIPNPILGVLTPSCEQIEAGEEKKYIVDIVEKKKGSSICTPRWQSGDRVVVKEKCPEIIPGGGTAWSCSTNIYGNSGVIGSVVAQDDGTVRVTASGPGRWGSTAYIGQSTLMDGAEYWLCPKMNRNGNFQDGWQNLFVKIEVLSGDVPPFYVYQTTDNSTISPTRLDCPADGQYHQFARDREETDGLEVFFYPIELSSPTDFTVRVSFYTQ